LESPNDTNGKEGHDEVGEDVDAGVHIPNRLVVDTFRSGLLQYLPVGMDRDTCEDGSEERSNTPSYTDGHDDVEWYAHFSQSKDPAVL
jgi:hypothetical protein